MSAWGCQVRFLCQQPASTACGDTVLCAGPQGAHIYVYVGQVIGSLPPYLRVVAELYEAGYNIGDATTRGYSEMAVSTARMTGSGTEAPSQAV